jgi:hypothetical protein
VIGTTNPFGAGQWQPEFAEALRGKDVVILGDNDEKGREHVRAVLGSLTGVAESVRVVEIPTDAGAKDVTDFMANHSNTELVELIGSAWCAEEVEYEYVPA